MPQRHNVSFTIRLLAFVLLFAIPSLYFPELLPAAVLPAVSVLAIGCGAFFSRSRLKLALALVSSAGAVIASIFSLHMLSGLFHTPKADVFFLRFSQALWILCVIALFSCLSTVLRYRTRNWKYYEPLCMILLLCALFWSQGNHSLSLLDHPVKAALFALVFMLLEITQCASFSDRKYRSLLPLVFFIPLLLAGIFLIVRTYNTLSVSNNGGLIQPTMFRFDFSPFLSLQDEIKTSNNLVMIVRTKEENTSTFLRRIYLSGWNPRKGFYEAAAPGENEQVKTVPDSKTLLEHTDYLLRNPVDQEYFIVNFDPSSLTAMDYPVSVTPYRIWDSSSFNGAYSVTSESTGFIPFELFDSEPPDGNATSGMTAEDLSFYTIIDAQNLEKLKPLAEGIVAGIPGYYDKILAMTAYLHDGDFRYSLKPGTAPDGDQLGWFLTKSKKGYCTYFAFSLCLMLRSVGIPARVAAGFFIQPDSGALDYYPIRANMAHAWVEVFFPKYGWISFDPTTTMIAEGENLEISKNPGGDEFLNLLNEIIDKRSLLDIRSDEIPESSDTGTFAHMVGELLRSIRKNAVTILAVFIALLAGAIFTFFALGRIRSQSPRKKILRISAVMYRRIGKTGSRRESVAALKDPEADRLFALEQKARFAPECTEQDAEAAESLIASIKKRYRRKFPFLCLVISLLLLASNTPSLFAEEMPAEEQPEILLARAENAILAENWENAISILSKGTILYPDKPEFRKTLGSLYFDQGLYEPAYKELNKALELGYRENDIFSSLADAASYLNRDEEALVFLKKYLDSTPDDLFAWSNYGWLCYKTHRLDEGIATLRQVIEKYGPDGNLYVGLGNLYTAAFNYLEAKKYYTLAINIAKERNQPYLSSIYYYNRSILEEIFYNFGDAYEDTELSLSQSPRSSGYLMQGELELRKLDFRKAFNQYLKAYTLDSTPLATIGLADTLLQSGHPTEAASYIESVRNKTDMAWIANYGTTTIQYQADLHKIQKDYYQFLKNREKYKFVHNLSTFLLSFKNRIFYSLQYWYHDTQCRVKNTQVAKHYSASNKTVEILKGQNLFINSYYFMAFDKWQQTALPYLLQAEEIENGYIPAAKPSYLYEKGTLTHDVTLLDEAIRTLDPVWERQYLSKALVERIKLTKSNETQQIMAFTSSLFELNPSAFIFEGIRLPVSIETEDSLDAKEKREYRTIKKYLGKVGFRASLNTPYKIIVSIEKDKISLVLLNRNNNNTIYAQTFHKTPSYQQDLINFINKFSTTIFSTDIGI